MDDEVVITASEQRVDAPPAPPRLRFGRYSHATILIAILVAALLAESVVVFRGSGEDRARDDVLAVSRRFAVLLTTYSADTIAAQRRQVLALATGKFKDEYDEITGPAFATTLKERQAESAGTLVRIAVSDVTDDAAKVLALVRVTTKNKDTAAPRVDENLLELSLVETSNGWKIDGVTTFGTLAG